MFWSLLDTTYPIEHLLNDQNLTITQLLDDHHVLQKCREQDPRLLNFLSRKENLSYLVDQICTPPSNKEDFDRNRYRHPNLACEILTSGIDVLTDGLLRRQEQPTECCKPPQSHILYEEHSNSDMVMVDSPKLDLFSVPPSLTEPVTSPTSPGIDTKISDSDMDICGSDANALSRPSSDEPLLSHAHLDRLLDAIDAPLNHLSFSFLSRVLHHLVIHRSDDALGRMRNHPHLLDRILSRFSTISMSDFVIQLLDSANPIVYQWFLDENLIPRLIEILSPTTPREVHEAASDCLIQVLKSMRTRLTLNDLKPLDVEDSDCGLPPTSPYAGLIDEDRRTVHPSGLELFDVLESQQIIEAVMDKIINVSDSNSPILSSCVDFLIALLDRRTPDGAFGLLPFVGDPPDQMNDFNAFNPLLGFKCQPTPQLIKRLDHVRSTFASVCLPRLSALHSLLNQPYPVQHGSLAIGGISILPFGRYRYSVAQLIDLLAALPVETGVPQALVSHGFVSTFMTLFERHPFHTLFHQLYVDFVHCLFTHANLLHLAQGLSVPNGEESSESQARPSTPVLTEDNSREIGEDGGDASMSSLGQFGKQDFHRSTKMDDSVSSIFKSHHIVDWCLRLNSCLSDLPINPELPPVIKCPKSGYSGHLWQISNLIQEARHGPRQDFMQGLFESLEPQTVQKWDSFVANQLAVINSQQVPDDIPSSQLMPSGCDTRMLFLSRPDLGNQNQLSSLRNIPNGLSLLITPSLSGGQQNVSTNLFGLNLMTDTLADPAEFNDEAAITFQSARLASVSSDEGDSDDAKPGDSNDEEEEGDDDNDDEEEDEEGENSGDVIRSPRLVIQQQRSTTASVPTIIGSRGAAYSWRIKSPPKCVDDASDPWSATADVSQIQMPSDKEVWADFDRSFPPSSTHEDSMNGEIVPTPREDQSNEVPVSCKSYPAKTNSTSPQMDPSTMNLP